MFDIYFFIPLPYNRHKAVQGRENMQEWMIAMLVISVLLVLRDMAKTFFPGKKFQEGRAA